MGRYKVRKVGSNVPLKRTLRYEELQPVGDIIEYREEPALEEEKPKQPKEPIKVIKEADRVFKVSKRLKQAGIQIENIISDRGPRVRAKRVVYDV